MCDCCGIGVWEWRWYWVWVVSEGHSQRERAVSGCVRGFGGQVGLDLRDPRDQAAASDGCSWPTWCPVVGTAVVVAVVVEGLERVGGGGQQWR